MHRKLYVIFAVFLLVLPGPLFAQTLAEKVQEHHLANGATLFDGRAP